ncbi:MAG: hypothetical protein M1544_02620 [Candidatus Marsarchaeota archaeon]|nr:hypothetical protein [Candidatus Marsarchaeota archaeon]
MTEIEQKPATRVAEKYGGNSLLERYGNIKEMNLGVPSMATLEKYLPYLRRQ